MTHATNLTAQLAPQHQDTALECAVLGLIINSATQQGPGVLPALETALEAAPADLMADSDHAVIWQGIRSMVGRGQVPGVLELSRALTTPVSQRTWDAVINDGTATTLAPNLERLALLSRLRSITRACALATAATATDTEPEEIIGGLLRELESGELGSARAVPTSELGDVLGYIDDLQSGNIPMISTGFRELDDRLGGGFEQGSFAILAMKTNVGKTKFAIRTALRQVEDGMPVAYLSGELKKTAGPRPTHRVKVMATLSAARVPGRALRRGTPDRPQGLTVQTRERLADAQAWLDQSGLFSIYDGVMDVEVVISLLRRLARESGGNGGLMVIDNIDHVTVKGFEKKGGWEARDEVARRIMGAAHATGVTVMALAQIKIDKSTSGQTGEIEDLAGFKGVVAHADCMITAWRDRKEAEQRALTPGSDPGKWLTTGEFAIVKRRSGVGGTVQVGWNEEFGEWFDLDTARAPVAPLRPQPAQEDESNMPRSIFDELFEEVPANKAARK